MVFCYGNNHHRPYRGSSPHIQSVSYSNQWLLVLVHINPHISARRPTSQKLISGNIESYTIENIKMSIR